MVGVCRPEGAGDAAVGVMESEYLVVVVAGTVEHAVMLRTVQRQRLVVPGQVF